MRNTHIEDDTLELYAVGRIKAERELARIEEHLLICTTCQDRLQAEDAFITQLHDTLARLKWSHTHLTEDGDVTLFIYLAHDGHYSARVVGADVDCGARLPSAAEAQTWCEDSFGQMFSEHVCGDGCG
jgi:hypothetical protein